MRSVWGGDRPPGLEEDAMCGRYALYGPVWGLGSNGTKNQRKL